MASVTWSGPDYIGANSRRANTSSPWSTGTATATFSGTAIPATATNIRAWLKTNHIQDGRNSSRFTLDGTEHLRSEFVMGAAATIEVSAPNAGDSSKSITLTHTPDDTSGTYVGSTWELKEGNSLYIEYDDDGGGGGETGTKLEWPEGAICRLNQTWEDVYTPSNAAIQCTAVSGAVGYEYQQTTDGVTWEAAATGNPATVYPSDNGLPRYFRVRALSPDGESYHSDWLACSNKLYFEASIAWPINSVCYLGDSYDDVYTAEATTIQCTAVPRAVGYQFQQTPDGVNWYDCGYTTPSTVYPDAEYRPLYFRVRALSSGGESYHTDWLACINVLYTISLQGAPSGARVEQAPYNPSVYTAYWNESGPPADGVNNPFSFYRVYLQDFLNGSPAGGSDPVLLAESTDNFCAFSAPEEGYTRKLLVYSVGSLGMQNGPLEVTLGVGKSNPTPPTVVTLTSETAASTSYLTWSGAQPGANNPITGYQVQVNEGGGWVDLPGHTNGLVGLVETVAVTPPAVGATAYYRVRTVATDSSYLYSDWKEADNSLARESSRPTAPTQVWLDRTSASDVALLYWGGARDGLNNPITGYTIQYQDNGGDWTGAYQVGVTNVLEVPAPPLGSTRYFRVRADAAAQGVDIYGMPKNCSDWSPTSAGLTGAAGACTPPTQITFNPTTITSTTTMTWTGQTAGTNNSISGYAIQRRTENGSWEDYTTTTTNSLVINLTGDPNVYYFRIMTLGANGGNSVWSASSDGIALAGSIPTTPGTPTFPYNPCTIQQTMKWTKSVARSGSITGYEVQSRNNTGEWATVATVTSAKMTIPAPEMWTHVYYRVRAIGTNGNSLWSEPSRGLMNAKTVFQEYDGRSMVWKITDPIDVHFVPARKKYIRLLAFVNDNIAHAWQMPVKDERQPKDISGWQLFAEFTHADGSVYVSNGWADGNIAKVCFPDDALNRTGLYHGVLYGKKSGIVTELDHLILTVEDR